MALKLITPPAAEPVTLQEAKDHLRVLHSDEDTYIEALITVSREVAESIQNRVYIEQEWELWLDAWPQYFKIPLPPLIRVDSIEYYGTDNTKYTLPVADYFIDTQSEPGRVVKSYNTVWPSTVLRSVNGICITFTAGYEAGTATVTVTDEAVGTGDGVVDTFFLANVPVVAATIYIDAVAVAPASYTLNLATGELAFTIPPALDEVITADYTYTISVPAANVPKRVKQAMLLLISHLYENREAVLTVGHIAKELPMGVKSLLYLDRVWPV
jgi:uncharacterized phiE125 gp8 family phage protein